MAAAFESLQARAASRSVDGITLLPSIDLTVRPGECLVLTGPNGSGKTTLLRLLTGMDRPTSGEVLLDGEPVDERQRRVRTLISALLEPIVGYRNLSVQDHLVLIDQLWGGSQAQSSERVDAMLERFDIAALHDRFLHELSSGQRQLVDLALTLMRPCGILVLDEPERRLDTGRKRALGRILLDSKRSGVAVVVACHDPSLTEHIADEVLALGDGAS